MSAGEGGAPTGKRPRRRRRPKGRGKDDAKRPGRGAKGEGSARAALAESRLDAEQPADVPLTAEEAAEMRVHLRFLGRHRKDLRLKVNAAENLLLSGGREPTHRGQCLHLLSKVDLPAVQSALDRLAEPKARVALLAGVVRFHSDPGVLLLYLEELQKTASRREAAAAFGAASERIDFAELSPARVRRFLEVVAHTFDGDDRVQALFGLLQVRAFREAFDRSVAAHEDELPPVLRDVFLPLRAAHDVVLLGRAGAVREHGAEALRRGVEQLLSATPEVLRSHPQPVRERLLESAIRFVTDPELADRAEATLLKSLPRDDRAFSRLGLLRAGRLLAAHRDEEAGELLRAIAEAHSGFRIPRLWLDALEVVGGSGKRAVGRVALDDGESGEARLRRGFWLDRQRSAWVRTAEPEDGERLAGEARLQRFLAVPGVAPVLLAASDPVPHVVVPGIGRTLDVVLRGERRRRGRPRRGDDRSGLEGRARVELVAEGLRVLNALALLGVRLPDAAPARFLVDASGSVPTLLLADLDGADEAARDDALAAHRAFARPWCEAVLGRLDHPDAPDGFAEAVERAPSLSELVALLAREG